MKRPIALILLLVAGCSAGSAARVSSPSQPVPSVSASGGAASTPPSAPASATTQPPSGASQAAVPAEKNPPGDIPDNVAFVTYRNAVGRYSFTHPEGWSETTRAGTATFTDKLNGVQVQTTPAAAQPTVDSAKRVDVPALSGSQAAFELRGVSAVTVPGGKGVRVVYRRNSAPDQVTGRQYRDEVERYELVSNGHQVVMELFGPVGADNVDAYRTMVQSLRLP